MPPRFYSPALTALGPATLTDAEAHHAAHVMRLQAGDALELFNGRGLVGQATVMRIHKKEVTCEVTSVVQDVPRQPEIVLATAVPKGERFDWLVEKATELGVARLIPLITQYSTVDPRDSKLDRLRQTVIAACKQARRSDLMDLSPAMRWSDFLKAGAGKPLIVAHPTGRPIAEVGSLQETVPSFSLRYFAIGPEGGFSEAEIVLAEEHGARLASLGSHLLRIETAGLALASWSLLQSP